jgi:hypothetical protein
MTGHRELVEVEGDWPSRESRICRYRSVSVPRPVDVPGVEKIDDDTHRKRGWTNSEEISLSLRVARDEASAQAFLQANPTWYSTTIDV